MATEITPEIQALEEELRANPDSEQLRDAVLFEYFTPGLGLYGDARRVQHIVEYIRRFPRTSVARCPFAHVSAVEFPEAFQQVEREWQRLHEQFPADPEIARGYAAFVASGDFARALAILEGAIQKHPEDPELWLDVGRKHPDPVERLRALEKARRLGSTQPNLLAWMAAAAMRAEDTGTVERSGNEMLSRAQEARSQHGERLDWPERGRALWQRARAACDSDESATVLVRAIGQHAHDKHWGHTALGFLALRSGDTSTACSHLLQSAAIVGDCRLSSYGPSFLLARELCGVGKWSAVRDYLRACEAFWGDGRMGEWVRQVEEHETPDFPDQ